MPQDNPPDSWATWAEEDGAVIGYMCRTDWEYEIGAASGGNVVYPTIEDARSRRRCLASCGIVEVEVRFRRVIDPGTSD